ncbi:hypothetical protein G6045_00225 [Streptomyces sp. YC504]|uniref:Transcriptional regulator n=1 Tax=Streptomyces mesophilus TaxID=1775132 RepID=A0A6G4XAE2_9ACTN|nr:hypothetical protein [Streptomyces mesophilus]NGO74122.1 hypothetical protein [Streptomyces mesophilus]
MAHPKRANSALPILLRETGLTGGELARHVNELGRSQGIRLNYDRTTVAHWLTGSRPRPPVPALVAQVLSRKAGRLIRPTDTGLVEHTPEPDSPPSAGPFAGRPDPVDQLLELCRTDADPVRCGILTRALYELPDSPTERWPADALPDLQQSAAVPLVGRARTADADFLHGLVEIFAQLDERYGGGRGRQALAACLRHDAVRYLVSVAPPELGARLLTATAQLTHRLAGMHLDMSAHGAAQQYHRAALALAHRADDRDTYARILSSMSEQASLLRHDHYALELAVAAVDSAGTFVAADTHALVLTRRGVARAVCGDMPGAMADMYRAASHLDPDARTPESPLAHPRSDLYHQWARLYESQGSHPRAATALQSSLQHRNDPWSRTYALTQARLARLLVRIGHLEAACKHTAAFLDQQHHFDSAQVRQTLAQLHQQFRPFHRQASARTVLQRLDAAQAAYTDAVRAVALS